jgi:hypothetical protein
MILLGLLFPTFRWISRRHTQTCTDVLSGRPQSNKATPFHGAGLAEQKMQSASGGIGLLFVVD